MRLTLVAKCRCDGGLDGVVAGTGGFGHYIGADVNDIGVVAQTVTMVSGLPRPPSIVSLPSPPVRVLAGAVADQDVVLCVAGTVDGGCAGERQVLDVAGKRVGDARLDQVRTFAGQFGDYVAGVVDDVSTRRAVPPTIVSAPVPPFSVSLLAPPVRVLATVLPVRMLSSVLPIPLIAVVPVSVSSDVGSEGVGSRWTARDPFPHWQPR